MARVLLITEVLPRDLSNGSDIRVQNFIKELAKYHDCCLVVLDNTPIDECVRKKLGVREICVFPSIPRSTKSLMRHFRISNSQVLRKSYPGFLLKIRSEVDTLIRDRRIELIFCLDPLTAEFVIDQTIPKLLDYCDSRTLTYRRMMASRASSMPMSSRFRGYVDYLRQRRRERHLVRTFEFTTTISPSDKQCLVEVAAVQDGVVVVVPNGVSPDALRVQAKADGRRRSVVFWGNLDFPPNWTAIDYFYQEIYLPYLAEKQVEWHIIGRGANDSIKKLAEQPGIFLHGFVDDLYGEISQHGAMVNPMIEGSGLKNKVLEAFACRLPVVSTTMGIEGVGAVRGQVCVVADEAEKFADAVIRVLDDQVLADEFSANARRFVEDNYTWETVGFRLNEVVTVALGNASSAKEST